MYWDVEYPTMTGMRAFSSKMLKEGFLEHVTSYFLLNLFCRIHSYFARNKQQTGSPVTYDMAGICRNFVAYSVQLLVWSVVLCNPTLHVSHY
jgi:hypothetical protein